MLTLWHCVKVKQRYLRLPTINNNFDLYMPFWKLPFHLSASLQTKSLILHGDYPLGNDDLDTTSSSTKEVFDSMLHELKHPAGAILVLLSSGQCSGHIMAAAEY